MHGFARVCVSAARNGQKETRSQSLSLALAVGKKASTRLESRTASRSQEVGFSRFVALLGDSKIDRKTMQERKGDDQSERNSRGEVRATSGKEGKSPNSARSKFLNCQQETKEKKRLEAMGLTKEYLVSEETTICTRKKLLFFLGN